MILLLHLSHTLQRKEQKFSLHTANASLPQIKFESGKKDGNIADTLVAKSSLNRFFSTLKQINHFFSKRVI